MTTNFPGLIESVISKFACNNNNKESSKRLCMYAARAATVVVKTRLMH